MKATLVALSLAAVGATAAPAGLERAASGLAGIRPRALTAGVRFLASDVLEGSAAGTRSHEVAELYVAAEFQAAGLEPAGDEGSFTQAVPIRAWRVDQDSAALAVQAPGQRPVSLTRGIDFVALSDGEHSEVEIEAPVVFAGYAISAPEFGYDDLRGADLRGRIAVVLYGAPLSDRPNFFPPAAHAAYADPTDKLRRLAERGAAGALFVHTPEEEGMLPWSTLARRAREEEMGWLEGPRLGAAVGGVPARGVLSMQGLERLLLAAGVGGGARAILEKADAGKLSPQAWKVRARLRSSTETRELTSRNVVGLLRGSDPASSSEVVIVSAALGPRGYGDPLAAPARTTDGAPALSVLLEVARALAGLPTPPRRSVLFLVVTTGGQGPVGSRFFALHPTVARERIVADLHIDGTPTVLPFQEAIAHAAGHSTLSGPVGTAAAALGVELSPEPVAGASASACPDLYSFVRQGIPSACITPEEKGVGHGERGSAGPPGDAGWDWEALARFARLQFLVAFLVADDAGLPRWNRGDFFERFALRSLPTTR
ncbi:MAG TPA: M28 family peptidase [Anaeromyxobacteraceae bacterium]|nr:M28 family peptidase [Anaeromyxobacteraceae bacterium]